MTILVIAPLAVGLLVLSRHNYRHTIEARHQAADLQNRILEVALRHEMIEKDTTLISRILSEIGDQPEVSSAFILDKEGVIRFSSDQDLIGTQIPLDSPTCLECHQHSPEDRSRWVLLGGEMSGHLRSVRPIENLTSCHGCHDPENRLNGILILDISLAQVQAQLRRDATGILVGAGVLGVVLLAGMAMVIRHLILRRLDRLGRAARAITGGDLDRRAPVVGQDVITSVSRDFNDMADSVSSLIREVREQEAQLESVMNSLDDGLVVMDRDLRIVATNRSFSKRLQAYPEGLRGRRCHEWKDSPLPCCAGDAECPTERCLTTGEVQRSTFRMPTGVGDRDLVEEVYASPVFDEEGKVVQVVEIWRDISERVREEERLAEIERLVSLGVLASGFSHEVNTPLASMLTCAEAVLGRVEGMPTASAEEQATLREIREHADTIRSEVHRCRKITEQFLRFSRGVPPSIEPLDLRKAVSGVVALVTPTAREAGVTIEVQGENRIPAVRANLEVVHHVVLNLLVNGIQSFPDGGGSIIVRFLAGQDVRVQIRDTGCGIPPESRKYLFEPFRSEKPHGTGLGLFLSRNFMRRFGGDVRLAASEVGRGSCFEIIFARAEGEKE